MQVDISIQSSIVSKDMIFFSLMFIVRRLNPFFCIIKGGNWSVTVPSEIMCKECEVILINMIFGLSYTTSKCHPLPPDYSDGSYPNIQDSLDCCSMLINADQNCGIDPNANQY